MTTLATVEDYANRNGALSAADELRMSYILEDASAAVRAAADGQTISRVTDDTVALRPQCGVIYLPQIPVVSVASIVDTDSNAVDFQWTEGDTFVIVGGGWLNRFDYEIRWDVPPPRFTVTYTHGYDPVPADIIGLVCQVAGRAFGTPAVSAGVTQESIGAYSYSVGAAAAAGAMGLLDDERRIARRYRRPARPISVLSCL